MEMVANLLRLQCSSFPVDSSLLPGTISYLKTVFGNQGKQQNTKYGA
jgi:hypothetical protein